ncbi:MAG: hypothetical protein A3B86_00115 [Candidatus Yanofskybacteria bacterium RIFCSPHIGHO2_02_FULL_38_22b]|uniref:Uncharacterized protein n=1 Tax=Candidatus Yanofskybacteria bacterium RIFCSPHIGHO2_02_FULL_38_22b TaxID=1802673 RepID=A0A1F8F311_9BACT|nr:MAG: hypothetical protein A2816_01055 [Candidatus Yanofskybacteria bacterium RIFCSPHIGHO2_01_FULL_39_44]OGN07000.1 MAG: hypothetical protein A3B86_00115 [Candidatus Yanofskybacteria bacterium RIFCSPHIGHO2_02_FULL_38_22b]
MVSYGTVKVRSQAREKKLKNISVLTATLFISLIFVSGCADKTKRIEGEVIKVSGTLPSLVESSGALFGNESVRLANPSLVYMVRVGNDIYTLDIKEGNRISRITLVPRICVGTRISFMVREVKGGDNKEFNPNHLAGSNSADDIGVPFPCLQ